jgi:hypothetical protein
MSFFRKKLARDHRSFASIFLFRYLLFTILKKDKKNFCAYKENIIYLNINNAVEEKWVGKFQIAKKFAEL